MKRKQITFYGRVQGVGFRYRSVSIARQLGLTGWVKNEWDGSVLMEVQGEDVLIDTLISRLENERFIRIERKCVMNMPLLEGERDFKERY